MVFLELSVSSNALRRWEKKGVGAWGIPLANSLIIYR